jgi:hypothetical protein
MSGWAGVDLSRYGLDEPLANIDSNAMHSAVASLQQGGPTEHGWTVRDIAERCTIGNISPLLVGSGATVADALQEWVEETDVDGFNLAYAVTPGSFADFVEYVVPVLTERGAYQHEYTPGTLRHKLLGNGDRLPENHRGASYRLGGRNSTVIERPSTAPSSPESVAQQPARGR